MMLGAGPRAALIRRFTSRAIMFQTLVLTRPVTRTWFRRWKRFTELTVAAR